MLRGARIAVVVPAHNESALIARVLSAMPAFVDQIVVVDDASDDDTCAQVDRCADERVTLVRHAANRGVGAAIVTGYRRARAQGAGVIAVMAGDDQMDPADLQGLVTPVIEGKAEYVKGDRLHHPEAARMPLTRRTGTRLLSHATRWALGMPTLSDSQCGYTAISATALDRLDLASVWPGFGYPNDLLARIVHLGMPVAEVVVRPVYKGERSELRPWHVLTILRVIGRAALRRVAGR